MHDTHAVTCTVTAPWTWDRRYTAGDTVTMTRAQFQYFADAMPGLLVPQGGAALGDAPEPMPAKTTKRKTDDD